MSRGDDGKKAADELRRMLEVRRPVQGPMQSDRHLRTKCACPPVVNIDITALAAKHHRLLDDTSRETRLTGLGNLAPEEAGRRRACRLAELNDRSFDPPKASDSLYDILRECAVYTLSLLIDGSGSRHKRGVPGNGGTSAQTTALQRRPVVGVRRIRKFGK